MKASPGRILMFVENEYPQDVRVKNECDALTGAGYAITLVSLGLKHQTRSELVDGVQVYRFPRLELFKKLPIENPTLVQRGWAILKRILGYATEYLYFTSACFVMSVYTTVRHGFDVIHAHNPPDSLFLVAFPYKLFGKKYVYDHHDLCPELYRSRYGATNDLPSRVLQRLEWCNLKLADITIATNESYKQVHITRGGRKPESVFIVRNGPSRNRMQVGAPSKRLKEMNKTILCYVGMMNPQDGVDYLLRALQHLRYDLQREDFYCICVGGGDSVEELRSLAKKLKLDGHVELTGYIPKKELEEILAAADICVDPDPSSPLNDVSTWIKIMEYMAYSKPIVTFDLKETRFSAQEAALYVEPNDETKFAKAIVKLMEQPDLRKKMGDFGRQRVENHLQWSVVSKELLRGYEALALRRTSNG
jgi:glycosyltransferase involved in cell wall biosynthesis